MNKKAKITLLSFGILFAVCIILVIGLVIAPAPRAAKACSDGIDNDGDGYTDYPDDPGCSRATDKSELNPEIECDDGSDNDGDSNIDSADSGCSGPTDDDETDCGDGVCEGGETSGTCPADCGYPDSCSDTDNGNYPLVFGTTSGYLDDSPYSNDDYCVDVSNIMEYYCSGDYEQSSQQSCGTDGYSDNYCSSGDVYKDYIDYSCSLGECDSDSTPELVEECDYGCTNGTCDPILDSCSDTDGGYVLETQGTASGYLNEQYYSDTDYCINSTYIAEYYCIGDYEYGGSATSCVGNVTTQCVSGACV